MRAGAGWLLRGSYRLVGKVGVVRRIWEYEEAGQERQWGNHPSRCLRRQESPSRGEGLYAWRNLPENWFTLDLRVQMNPKAVVATQWPLSYA